MSVKKKNKKGKAHWLNLKNPETGRFGGEIEQYCQKNDMSLLDVTVKTGISPSYLRALIVADKPIKQNLMDRLKGQNGFAGLKGF